MRWLHLTDFHVRAALSTSQLNVWRELVAKIGDACADPCDAVFLTGDLAYSGRAPEYDAFSQYVLSPLRAIPALASAAFFAAPGNHDLNCARCLPSPWDSLGTRQRTFFEETDEGREVREPRALAMAGFEKFVATERVGAPLPTQMVTSVHPGLPSNVTVVVTNTSMLCDKDDGETHREHMRFPLVSVRNAFLQVPDHSRIILLGHHPLHWFAQSDRDQLKELLETHSAIYLHGHEHTVLATCGPTRLWTLGFGAVYPGPMEEASIPAATSFAICEWRDALDVCLYDWANPPGRWRVNSAPPPEFREPSSVLPGGYRFSAPSSARESAARSPSTEGVGEQDSRQRRSPVPTRIILAGGTGSRAFLELLAQRGHLPELSGTLESLRVSAEDKLSVLIGDTTRGGRRLRYHVVTAPGDVTQRQHIERASITIDFERLHQYTFVTTGEVSGDARSALARLGGARNIRILATAELVQMLGGFSVRNLPPALARLDAASATVQLVVASGALFALFSDPSQTSWFCLVAESGDLVSESLPLVAELREMVPSLARCIYGSSGAPVALADTPFDAASYLEALRREHNAIKYPGLAAVGLRLMGVELDQLYVELNAAATDGRPTSHALRRAVESAFSGSEVLPAFRAELEEGLRRHFGLTGDPASDTLTNSYQEHGAILILGDPGSGKTCFVKRQILAYARAEANESWYSAHLPVYVSLAEAAPMFSGEQPTDLLTLCAQFAAKKGLHLPVSRLQEEAARGRLALFCDGLDEVASIDARVRIVSFINEFVERSRSTGSRIVVTSRPAAAKLVMMSESLRRISLQGLGDAEMRMLAERVLATRTTDTALVEATPAQGDERLVDRIVADCQSNASLDQVARNPLLLTLLIMIYANYGAAAAKRHLIYQQAIKTLVSVRSRSASERVFSEQDLRARLGAVAVSTLRDSAFAVPGWHSAIACVRAVIAGERQCEVSEVAESEVTAFLQELGEASGIVIPDASETDSRGGSLVFMHQSFFEYYAAWGLMLEDGWPAKAAAIAEVPRWREVLLLLAGTAGERGAVGGLLEAIHARCDERDSITLRRVIICFDCALEVEVPSEATHRALLGMLRVTAAQSMANDAGLRARIGELLGRLYAASGSGLVLEYLEEFFGGDAGAVATGVMLLAHMAGVKELPQSLVARVWQAAKSREPAVTKAVCDAVAICNQLHVPSESGALVHAFSAARPIRASAFRAARRWPEFAVAAWPQLLEAMGPSGGYERVAAANAVLRAGWYVGVGDIARAENALSAIAFVLELGTLDDVEGLGRGATLEEIVELRQYSDRSHRLLSTALLPWVAGSETAVYDILMEVVRSGEDHEEVALALGALRLSRGTQDLLRVADKDDLVERLKDKHRNVRRAAASVLAELEYDAHCLASLIAFLRRDDLDEQEYEAALGGVVNFAERPEAQAFVEEQFALYSRKQRRTSRNIGRLLCAMRGVQALTQTCSGGTSRVLREIVDFHGWSLDVRSGALLALSAAAEPEEAMFSMLLTKLRANVGLSPYVVYEATALLLERCQDNLEYFGRVVGWLGRFETELVRNARNLTVAGMSSVEREFQQLRRALEAVGVVRAVQTEFAGVSAALDT